MDKLLALQTFTVVADTGGFSKAARQLGTATSSVTRLMDALEASLGVTLLTRTTRHVTLTDAGATYLDQVGGLLSQLVEADESVADAGGEPVGTLRVSVPVTYARIVLGPHLSAFLDEYPRVSLDLVVSDAYLDLATDRIDVAVRIGAPSQDPGLVVRKLMENRRIVVASHDYLDRMGTPVAPGDLASHRCLRFPYRQGRQSWTFSRDGQSDKVEINGRLTANSLDVLRESVLSGQGIALVPTWLVHDDIVAGRMLPLFESWCVTPPGGGAQVYAAYLPNRRHSRKVRTFIAFLAERMPDALDG
ncbi:LysR family transcriptional regulator [Burkholderia mayonis]|uniref:LysR family transcriptional regulator n=1 Tax=Burkholderia mayonis TaxID=1385591 RepID=A0A1B4FK79_9BURK|nr:LysR family transcriptional regulator [Burkholderia mayonis]AOJ04081.1 LysR family transcriptional regulator [Burkholderia mayonis]KVE46100.1 LysR family transcriptional regulator [Burkholderia mayonis]